MIKHIKLLLFCSLICACSIVYSQPWTFDKALDVASTTGPDIFHHVESSGRRSIAVSDSTVAVVWEDERANIPQVFLARKSKNANHFSREIQISGQGEAYEPGLIALPDQNFAIVWEENEGVYARLVNAQKQGPSLLLSNSASGQASLIASDNRLFVVYSARQGKFQQIKLSELRLTDKLELQTVHHCTVDPLLPEKDQFYPVVSVVKENLMVAWEDRRLGHTIIMSAYSQLNDVCRFNKPVRISESTGKPKQPFGAGHGVARVALANYGDTGLYAVWADKRDFLEGYDIFGTDLYTSDTVSANQKVQDDFGGQSRQWHSTISGHPNGQLVAAWTDEREGNADVWMSWMENGKWSEDITLDALSGLGEQAHPAISLDTEGNLHIVWVERDSIKSATRIKYLSGQSIK